MYRIKISQPELERNGELEHTDYYTLLMIRDSRGKNLFDANKEAIENGKVMLESHYFVNKKGNVFYVRPEGTQTELGRYTTNRYTLLIEVEGDFESEDLEPIQGNSLLELCKDIFKRHQHIEHINCLYEFIPSSKSPGPNFPINYLNELVKAKAGFYVKVKPEVPPINKQDSLYGAIYMYKCRELYLKTPYLNGNDVLTLKFKLGELGLPISKMTEFYDEEAVDAINELRKSLGLPLTGIATIELMDEIDIMLNKRVDYSQQSQLLKRVLAVRTPYMVGSDVEQVQLILQSLKLYEGPINSKYTTEVEKAVKQFQYRNNLDENGKVDPITWSKLKEINYIKFTRLIYVTEPLMEGEDIFLIQKQLVHLGYNVELTSVYDVKTEKALKKFQLEHGLRSDGIINIGTFNTLFGIKDK